MRTCVPYALSIYAILCSLFIAVAVVRSFLPFLIAAAACAADNVTVVLLFRRVAQVSVGCSHSRHGIHMLRLEKLNARAMAMRVHLCLCVCVLCMHNVQKFRSVYAHMTFQPCSNTCKTFSFVFFFGLFVFMVLRTYARTRTKRIWFGHCPNLGERTNHFRYYQKIAFYSPNLNRIPFDSRKFRNALHLFPLALYPNDRSDGIDDVAGVKLCCDFRHRVYWLILYWRFTHFASAIWLPTPRRNEEGNNSIRGKFFSTSSSQWSGFSAYWHFCAKLECVLCNFFRVFVFTDCSYQITVTVTYIEHIYVFFSLFGELFRFVFPVFWES